MKVKHQLTRYLRIKFALAIITLITGLIGGTIALFQWIERGDLYYLFGGYARYVLGFSSFVAMIFGSLLLNDTWIAWKIFNGKYKFMTHVTHQARITDFFKRGGTEAKRGQ